MIHASPPALQLVHRAPLVVHGRGFRAGEEIRVYEFAPMRRTVRIRARADGGFVVTLLTGDRCSAASVFAQGTSGDGARLKVPPPPGCAPAASP